jgi:putative heme iron utilization protein
VAEGSSWLTPEIVDAVRAHMNGDHAADNVVICRGVGGHPSTSEATMTGMDLDGIDFAVVADGTAGSVRIPFADAPLRERAQVRAEVTRMFRESCELLGLEVPEHARGDH